MYIIVHQYMYAVLCVLFLVRISLEEDGNDSPHLKHNQIMFSVMENVKKSDLFSNNIPLLSIAGLLDHYQCCLPHETPDGHRAPHPLYTTELLFSPLSSSQKCHGKEQPILAGKGML